MERERLTLDPGYPGSGYPEQLVVCRPEVDAIVSRPQRIVPFMWSTFITVRLTDGTYFKKMFIPFRARTVLTQIRNLGWPVEFGGCLGWRSIAQAPRP